MTISREYITVAGSTQQHDIPASGSVQVSMPYGILTVNKSNNNRTWSFVATSELNNSNGKAYGQSFAYNIIDDGTITSKSHTINVTDGDNPITAVDTFSDTTLVMGESATSKLNGSQGSDLISNRQIVVNGGVYNLASTVSTSRGTFAISNPTANTTNFTFTPSATGTTTVQYRLTDTDGDVVTSAGKSVNTSALIKPVATITNLSASSVNIDRQLTGKLSNTLGSYPLASQRMQIGSTWYTLTSNSLSTTYGTFTFSNRGTNSTSFVFTPSKTSTFGIKYRTYDTKGNYDDSPTTNISVTLPSPTVHSNAGFDKSGWSSGQPHDRTSPFIRPTTNAVGVLLDYNSGDPGLYCSRSIGISGSYVCTFRLSGVYWRDSCSKTLRFRIYTNGNLVSYTTLRTSERVWYSISHSVSNVRIDSSSTLMLSASNGTSWGDFGLKSCTITITPTGS